MEGGIKTKRIQSLTILASLAIFMLGACQGSKARYSSQEEILTTNDRSYEYTYEFPYAEMEYAASETFVFLHNAYNNVNFYGEFLKGDAEKSTYYIEKYKKLVNNEITFLDQEEGNEYLIKDFEYLAPYTDDEYDRNKYEYLFFDFDNDSIPELCVINSGYKYIFKYVAATDKYILSDWLTSNGSINGSLKIRSVALGTGQSYTFLILNAQQLQDRDCMVLFFFKPISDTVAYVAGLPKYSNDKEQIDIPEEIKNQAYYCRSQDVYYFRVTEEQFELLSEEYGKAEHLSEEQVREVTYTYEQLFGDMD